MWPFFSKRVAPRRVVVIDVGTDSVGCALASLAEKQPPILLFSVRVPIALAHEPRTADRLMERVRLSARQAFDRVASFTHRDASDAPVSRLTILLGSPWSALYVRNVRFMSSEAERADQALLDRLAHDYLKRQRPDEDESIIERIISDVRLDGSQVAGLSRRRVANRVEMTALTSGAYTPLVCAMRDEARRSFGIRPDVSFHNADAAYSRVLSAAQSDRSDFVLCNAGGEVTSLLVARDHTPVVAATMPTGFHLPLRTLVAHHHLSHEEARSALSIALGEEAPFGDRVHAALRRAGERYAEDFDRSFTRIAPMTGSTPTLYALGDSAGARWSADLVMRAPAFENRYPMGLRKERVDDAWLTRTNAVHVDPRCAPDTRLQLAAMSCMV